MKFPLHLVLELRTQDEFDKAKELLDSLKGTEYEELATRGVVKLADGATEARVLINGQRVAVGTKEDMIKRYQTECAVVTKANIVMQEWENGDYVTKRARRLQPL